MFSHIISDTFHSKLQLSKLSKEDKDCLKTVSSWVEKKWGYIRRYPGIEKRMELVARYENNTYIVKYDKQPVGMFALFDYPLDEEIKAIKPKATEPEAKEIKAIELMDVYVEERFRGLGIGSRIVYYASKKAKESGAHLLVLDTLNPHLNSFYEKLGAKIICESQFKVKNEKYDLCLMTDEIKPEHGKLYVKKSKKGLEYTVLDPSNTVVTGIITEAKLPGLKDKEPSVVGLEPLLPDILAITSGRRHTGGMLTYPSMLLSIDLKKLDTVTENRGLKRRYSFS